MRKLALATLTAAAALAVAAPGFAQTVDELTVTGRIPGERPMTLSRTVSYADLDLTRHADRERLRLRIIDTARRICGELNEDSPSHNNLGKSCQDVAVRGAMDQVRLAFADARAAPAYVDAYGAPVSAIAPEHDYDVPPAPPPRPYEDDGPRPDLEL